MSLMATMQGGNAPLEGGTYPVICTDIKDSFIENSQFGTGDVWKLTVETTETLDSNGRGVELTAIANAKLTPNSKMTKWLNAFGIAPEIGETVNLEGIVGKSALCLVTIKKTETGEFSRVEDFMPLPRGTTRTAPEAAQRPAQASEKQLAYMARLRADVDKTEADVWAEVGVPAEPISTEDVSRAVNWLLEQKAETAVPA